ncbi:hypothetical protein M569_07833, partial [Genlisea aurea]
AARDDFGENKPTKIVTFLGKGGSGKTTAAVFAAQHYALTGLQTCLVIHSQDLMAEFLLDAKIGPSPVQCSRNLSAVRFETTKMILEPIKNLKKADARLNLTQGVLEGVVVEELGVLPGMDSIFSILELERVAGFLDFLNRNDKKRRKYDVIVYDGINSDDSLRMIGATSKAKLYLKYLRSLADNTDLGRLAGPSILRLIDDALSLSTNLNGRTSSEIWDRIEKLLQDASSMILGPETFGCYLVMDPDNSISRNAALRYWGCAIQAGVQVSGAFGLTTPRFPTTSSTLPSLSSFFSPLPFAFIPHLESIGWIEIMSCDRFRDARKLLSESPHAAVPAPLTYDPSNKSVKLFMPGFDKSEIKLYQFRGGSELVVEAGDQRRVIMLPDEIQGKVASAKFVDTSLIVTMR